MYLREQTLDDLMRVVLENILANGKHIVSTKGGNIEISGVLLELSNPRARLSRTESRGKPFSCLGEFCWYLSETDTLDFIRYYLPAYREYAENGKLYGAYGPRLFSWNGLRQFSNVVSLLRKKPNSRQAVIQLFSGIDINDEHKDVPCTSTLQFLVRDDALNLVVNMRSNDFYWGLPHDIFCFTMLQEVLARTLLVGVGTYKHIVGSLHLYDDRLDDAKKFLDEGWQQTDLPMPSMPMEDPWPAIEFLKKEEMKIRNIGIESGSNLSNVHPYWADLVRLLQVFRCLKDGCTSRIVEIKSEVKHQCYVSYIERRLLVN